MKSIIHHLDSQAVFKLFETIRDNLWFNLPKFVSNSRPLLIYKIFHPCCHLKFLYHPTEWSFMPKDDHLEIDTDLHEDFCEKQTT
jgi:hypothetical protein